MNRNRNTLGDKILRRTTWTIFLWMFQFGFLAILGREWLKI